MSETIPNLVTTIIPVYNRPKMINKAVESVLMQKVDFEYELVIGEDCSTDNTREICEDYSKNCRGKIKLLPT